MPVERFYMEITPADEKEPIASFTEPYDIHGNANISAGAVSLPFVVRDRTRPGNNIIGAFMCAEDADTAVLSLNLRERNRRRQAENA